MDGNRAGWKRNLSQTAAEAVLLLLQATLAFLPFMMLFPCISVPFFTAAERARTNFRTWWSSWRRRDAPAADQPTESPSSAAGLHVAVHISKSALSAGVIQCSAFRCIDRLPLTWGQMLHCLAHEDASKDSSDSLRSQMEATLSSCPFQDFFWECSPVSAHRLSTPFHFVMIDATGSLLHRRAASTEFIEHLAPAHAKGRLATAFPNLGYDATLIAPTRQGGTPSHVYGHLASFVRGAPAAQQAELWRVVSLETQRALQEDPEATVP